MAGYKEEGRGHATAAHRINHTLTRAAIYPTRYARKRKVISDTLHAGITDTLHAQDNPHATRAQRVPFPTRYAQGIARALIE